MKGLNIQSKYRSGMAILLAVVMVALSAAPSLAWADKGGPGFQPARGDSLIAPGHRVNRAVHIQPQANADAIQFGTREFPWSLARAE